VRESRHATESSTRMGSVCVLYFYIRMGRMFGCSVGDVFYDYNSILDLILSFVISIKDSLLVPGWPSPALVTNWIVLPAKT
jgi:hypothetical protein